MSVELIDGPRGVEARFRWTELGTGSVLATLNDLTVWPRAEVKELTGLFDFPEVEDNSEPRTEAAGNIPRPSRARTKNVTFTVEVQGETLQEMRAHGAALRAAFGPDIVTGLVPDRLMLITPHPDLGVAEHAFVARCLQFTQGSDAQAYSPNYQPTPYIRSVVIGLKLYDPRIYEWDPEAPLGLTNPKW